MSSSPSWGAIGRRRRRAGDTAPRVARPEIPMWDSVLLYVGLMIAGAAVLSMIKLRWRRVLIAAGGLLLIVVAFALPANEKHAVSRASHLDNAMPVWQFDE